MVSISQRSSRNFIITARIKALNCAPLCASNQRLRTAFYNPQRFMVGEKTKKTRARGWRLRVSWLLNSLIFLSVAVLLFYYLPSFITDVFHLGEGVVEQDDNKVLAFEALNRQTVAQVLNELIFKPNLVQNYQGEQIAPRYDLSLPEGKWFRTTNGLIVAPIMTNRDPDDLAGIDQIMRQGAYLYTDYSEMGRKGRSVILASHHFNMFVGDEERKKTFQNLSQLKVGDEIELIDDYKAWKYRVYKIEKATTISESVADLIAYTCVFWWDSKLRLFVYGELLPAEAQT